MKVILLQDIQRVGSKGDILEVSEGYARNFLLPRKLAIEATRGHMKELEQKKAAEVQKKNQMAEEARSLAGRLEALKVRITTKAGEGGRLFGSITSKDITEALKIQHQIEIDKKKVNLLHPIKTLGVYPVAIKLHPQAQAMLQVEVVRLERGKP